MKQRLLLLSIPLLVTGLMLFTSFGGSENSDYPNGSPAGYTGSPYDAKDCHNCHGGSTAFVANWITSNIPPEGYTPGTSYAITVTVTGSGEKGFEVSPHDASGNLLGTLTAGTGNKLVGSGKYVTQTSGSTANPKSWTFGWTAPAAGTGEVTFWGAFCVGKPTTKTSTLVVQENPLIPLTVHATANPTLVHIGDSAHLGVEVSGGSGTYTYAWSSNPAGFSSTLPDPWVIPAENTIYIVSVSDEITVVSDSVEVSVYGVGTDEPTPETGLSCFPNPVRNHLTVSVSEPDIVNAVLTIYTFTGDLMLTRKIEGTVSGISMMVDMSSFASGTYLLQIRDGKKQISRKIVKGN